MTFAGIEQGLLKVTNAVAVVGAMLVAAAIVITLLSFDAPETQVKYRDLAVAADSEGVQTDQVPAGFVPEKVYEYIGWETVQEFTEITADFPPD